MIVDLPPNATLVEELTFDETVSRYGKLTVIGTAPSDTNKVLIVE